MTEVRNNYILGEKRPLHLPGAHLDIPILTEKDELDLNEFAVKNGVDMVAISLVRSAENIETVKDSLRGDQRGEKLKIFAKIENLEGLKRIIDV